MMQRSPHAIDATAHGAQVIQVETLGRNGVFILWFSAILCAVAITGLIGLGLWNRALSARIYVLEYDMRNVCGQLIADEIIEVCH